MGSTAPVILLRWLLVGTILKFDASEEGDRSGLATTVLTRKDMVLPPALLPCAILLVTAREKPTDDLLHHVGYVERLEGR